MSRTIIGLLLLVLAGCATTDTQTGAQSPASRMDYAGTQKVTPNGYGLGVNRDQYGAPHVYRQQDGTAVEPIFQGGVKRDAYGAGVHMDQFGRPVYDSRP